MVRFTLNIKPSSAYGMNAIYSGRHWAERKKQASAVHMLVRTAIRKQIRNPQMFRVPVSVSIYYNSRLDIDNHGYLAKLIIDGMKGVLIEDDDRRFVRSLHQGFHSEDKNLIFVEVEEHHEGGAKNGG